MNDRAEIIRAIRSMLEDEFHPQSTIYGDVTRAEAVDALDALTKQAALLVECEHRLWRVLHVAQGLS